MLIKRRIIPGIPAALTVWVSSTEAYAEVQFDDDEPAMNEALLEALMLKRADIEHAYGEKLDWRAQEAGSLMTKRTKVVTPKVAIGDRAEPTSAGLEGLAEAARRLLAAVKPNLPDVFEQASVSADISDSGETPDAGDESAASDGSTSGISG